MDIGLFCRKPESVDTFSGILDQDDLARLTGRHRGTEEKTGHLLGRHVDLAGHRKTLPEVLEVGDEAAADEVRREEPGHEDDDDEQKDSQARHAEAEVIHRPAVDVAA